MKHARASLIGGILFFLAASLFSIPHEASAGTLDDLNNQIDQKRQALLDQQNKIDQYNKQISEKQGQAATIENEISLLSTNIDKTQAEIDANAKKIDLLKSEIDKTNLEISAKEKDIAKEKQLLAAFIVDLAERDQENPIEIWLKNNSFSDFLNESAYVQDLQKQGQTTLDQVQSLKADLEWKNQTLGAQKDEVTALQKQLKDQEAALESQQASKQEFLDQTHNDEQTYQNLLKESKAEVDQENADIADIQRQIKEEEERQRQNSSSGQTSPLDSIDPNGDAIFSWPVQPLRGISTRFCDPGYPFKYLYPNGCHPGLDIPTPQGTQIAAAAAGVILKVRYTGTTQYQYAIILHDGGWTTIYGHMTSFAVNVGDRVSAGQTIGTSGGRPGSIGSGTSSGAHLHFETRKNGVAIDPMKVLP